MAYPIKYGDLSREKCEEALQAILTDLKTKNLDHVASKINHIFFSEQESVSDSTPLIRPIAQGPHSITGPDNVIRDIHLTVAKMESQPSFVHKVEKIPFIGSMAAIGNIFVQRLQMRDARIKISCLVEEIASESDPKKRMNRISDIFFNVFKYSFHRKELNTSWVYVVPFFQAIRVFLTQKTQYRQ